MEHNGFSFNVKVCKNLNSETWILIHGCNSFKCNSTQSCSQALVILLSSDSNILEILINHITKYCNWSLHSQIELKSTNIQKLYQILCKWLHWLAKLSASVYTIIPIKLSAIAGTNVKREEQLTKERENIQTPFLDLKKMKRKHSEQLKQKFRKWNKCEKNKELNEIQTAISYTYWNESIQKRKHSIHFKIECDRNQRQNKNV